MISIIDSIGLVDSSVCSSLPPTPSRVTVRVSARPLPQRGGGTRPPTLQAVGQLLQLGGGPLGVAQRPGGAQAALHQRPLGLGQVVGDVAFLVPTTPLDEGLGAE